ncbi:phosphoglucosamine mutase [Leeia sp. TBRC 13508]|uniref:Phosphoglucosamine mutase n=1 Tax=Leeia speluncae TaxID=2884804 RepID=A0ABS8D246_9NEIS|nr:phosphoglucosamine mutase [Leeia speluncae]MCB6182267.1 phosphoglucosamine mutase [Leeia speluncae]
MSRKYFGTDGVRGRVGEYPITPEFALKLGYAAGKVFSAMESRHSSGERPAVIIGKDTRVSGYMLEAALQAGLTAAGVDVYLVGPLPTPGIAYLVRALRLHAGVVISASHNPFFDNGIKFFGPGGWKLPDETELEIEAWLDRPLEVTSSEIMGKATRINDAKGRYIEFCKSTFSNDLDLRDLKIVVDCAHGATYQVAPSVFHELGAQVIAMGNQPNGLNINEGCGATSVKALQNRVIAESADLGIALDGDGDRLIMVDENGDVYDGDQLIYLIATARAARGLLKGGVVGTLMTNMAIEVALKERGIEFARAKVGDRYVLELLQQNEWQVGGESSGHVLCLDKHSTGDGIVSALQVLEALITTNKTLSKYASEVALFPQTMINVKMPKGFDFQNNQPIQACLNDVLVELNGNGRVLLRPSGTEPVIRVMVEAKEAALALACANKLAKAVEEAVA